MRKHLLTVNFVWLLHVCLYNICIENGTVECSIWNCLSSSVSTSVWVTQNMQTHLLRILDRWCLENAFGLLCTLWVVLILNDTMPWLQGVTPEVFLGGDLGACADFLRNPVFQSNPPQHACTRSSFQTMWAWYQTTLTGISEIMLLKKAWASSMPRNCFPFNCCFTQGNRKILQGAKPGKERVWMTSWMGLASRPGSPKWWQQCGHLWCWNSRPQVLLCWKQVNAWLMVLALRLWQWAFGKTAT